MRNRITGVVALLLIAFAGSAIAQLETLAPVTARAEVAASKGVVVVDLFADW